MHYPHVLNRNPCFYGDGEVTGESVLPLRSYHEVQVETNNLWIERAVIWKGAGFTVVYPDVHFPLWGGSLIIFSGYIKFIIFWTEGNFVYSRLTHFHIHGLKIHPDIGNSGDSTTMLKVDFTLNNWDQNCQG